MLSARDKFKTFLEFIQLLIAAPHNVRARTFSVDVFFNSVQISSGSLYHTFSPPVSKIFPLALSSTVCIVTSRVPSIPPTMMICVISIRFLVFGLYANFLVWFAIRFVEERAFNWNFLGNARQ